MTTPQKLLLTWALLIMGSCGHKSDAQTNLSDVNDQIALTRTNIRAIRDANRRGIARTLDRNSDYRYTVENRTRVDSLRTANADIIRRACQCARATAVFTIVPNNSMVFHQYSHIPSVRSLRTSYELNQDDIKRYERHASKTDGFERRVKNHYDSIMYADLAVAHARLDSLLNVKHQLIINSR